MKRMKPAAGINQTTSDTVERVAKIAVKFLTWLINHIKIHSCAYNTSATLPVSITKKGISQSATSKCGGGMCIRFTHVVIIHSSTI